ncbi:GntR family transcriptional regulator [Gilliamella sp. ESL0405]|uniref:GntR family transcriptional regulator n=1 Tax=Gilliamella sp. ESL0405 TaxID=2704653 RepID=UPI001C69965E|nr:GntR family transcriptional regulator [Gilliamella sp. ESL0405]QYN46791.1 substrate-binding domain-containing protein [Gilliamella sp. ESL0405]
MANKSEQIYQEILLQIKSGVLDCHSALPSSSDLSLFYKTSRPTISKVFSKLKNEGYIEGKQGGKFYVRQPENEQVTKYICGILAPRLEQDESRMILDSLYSQIASLANDYQFSLLWAGMLTKSQNIQSILNDVEKVIINYTKNNIHGIFFTPLEFHPYASVINQKIIDLLNQYEIPCILLERDYCRFPHRGMADLVSIDNIAAGYIVTQHFLEQNHKQIAFVSKSDSANTIALRIIGYKQALVDAGITKDWIIQIPQIDEKVINQLAKLNIKHVVCGNDFTAMQLISLNQRINPKHKLFTISFDDADYACHLATPLSTYRQPLASIALTAVETLIQRVNNPALPIRTIYVNGELVIRASSGT